MRIDLVLRTDEGTCIRIQGSLYELNWALEAQDFGVTVLWDALRRLFEGNERSLRFIRVKFSMI